MGRSRFKFKETHYPYFITSSMVDGISLFAYPNIANIILDALIFLRARPNSKLYGFVIMHNHIHLIVESPDISSNLRTFKSFTARSIIDELKKRDSTYLLKKLNALKHEHHKDSEYQVWQEGVHPKQVHTPEMMIQKLEYIHFNPVNAGFVDNPEHW